MLEDIAYFTVFGRSMIFYTGILTFISFAITASIALLNARGIKKIPFKWHHRMAALSFTLAIIHGFLAAAVYL